MATNDGYRVRCARLPGKTEVEIVMAVVTMPAPGVADEPVKNVFDKSYRIRLGRGDRSFWFGHADAPDAVYGPIAPVKMLSITGSSTVAQQVTAIDERVEVHDVLGEAAKRIPRP
jgi:hypothetical protein